MCIPFETIPPPTEKCKKIVDTLRTVLYIQIAIAILEMFINPFSGIFEFFAIMILYQAYSTISYCNLIIYIFFCAMNEIQYLLSFGDMWQNRETFQSVNKLTFIVSVVCCIFYTLAIYQAFIAYREFKAVAMSGALGTAGNGGGLMGGGGMSQPLNRGQDDYETQNGPSTAMRGGNSNSNSNTSNQNSGFQAFQGRGVALG